MRGRLWAALFFYVNLEPQKNCFKEAKEIAKTSSGFGVTLKIKVKNHFVASSQIKFY